MNKTLVALAVVIIAGLSAYYFYFNRQNQTGLVQTYMNGPFTFQYRSKGPDKVVATFQGQDIGISQLLELSEPLNEIYEQQAQLILGALSKIPDFGKKSHLIQLNLFASKFSKDYATEPGQNNDQLHSPFDNHKVEFKPDYGSDAIVWLDGKKFKREDLQIDQVYLSFLQTKTFYLQMQLLTEWLERKIQIPSHTGSTSTEAKNHSVTFYFNLPQYQFHINTDVAYTQKTPDAKTVFIFSDLSCGPCQAFTHELTKLRDAYSEKVNFAFFNFNSENDRFAQIKSEAAVCLGYQNTEFFWSFLDKIGSSGSKFDEAKIFSAAEEVGSDVARLKQCLNNRESSAKVKSQINAAKALGVTMKPTVIIGNQVFAATIRKDQMLSAIQEFID